MGKKSRAKLKAKVTAEVPPEAFDKAKAWAGGPEATPEFVRDVILALQGAQEAGEENSARAKRAVEALARAMGIIPSSEKAPKRKPATEPVDEELRRLLDDEARLKAMERYVSRKLAAVRRDMAEAATRKRTDPQTDGGEDETPRGPSLEAVLAGGTPTGHDDQANTPPPEKQVDDMGDKAIPTENKTLRRDFAITRKNWTLGTTQYYDPTTGRTLAPDMSDVGPAGWNVTWRAMVNVIVLVFGMAVPGSRIEKLLGKDGFSRSNISDMCAYVATRLLPVYIALCERLAQADIIMGDDCVSRVTDVTRYLRALRDWKKARKAAPDAREFEKASPPPTPPWEGLGPDSLTAKLNAEMDFSFQHERKDTGRAPKIRLHTSLLSALTRASEPKSRVVIYRTHLGSVGNLLSRVLLSRQTSCGPLTFVGDLSSSNRVSDPQVAARVQVDYAGCASHARRPFKRHLEHDYDNCLEALDYFRALFHVEEIIEDGRTRDCHEIRQKYSLKFWNQLKELCESMQSRWSPDTALGEGIGYVLGNFDALTRYCNDSRLPLSNDLSERLLRYEKLMDRSSFGRETIEGRARYDIIRSFWQTCVAASVDPTFALLDVLLTPAETVAASAADYTPLAIAERLRAQPERALHLDRILSTSEPAKLITYKIHDPRVPRTEGPA